MRTTLFLLSVITFIGLGLWIFFTKGDNYFESNNVNKGLEYSQNINVSDDKRFIDLDGKAKIYGIYENSQELKRIEPLIQFSRSIYGSRFKLDSDIQNVVIINDLTLYFESNITIKTKGESQAFLEENSNKNILKISLNNEFVKIHRKWYDINTLKESQKNLQEDLFDRWFVYDGVLEQLKGKVKSIKQKSYEAKPEFDEIEKGKSKDNWNIAVTFYPDGTFESLKDYNSKGRLVYEVLPVDSVKTNPPYRKVEKSFQMNWQFDEPTLYSTIYKKDGTDLKCFKLEFDKNDNIKTFVDYRPFQESKNKSDSSIYQHDFGHRRIAFNTNDKHKRPQGEYSLNEKGLVVKFRNEENVISLRNSYSYDRYGNWVVKTVRKDKPTTIIERQIEYYDDSIDSDFEFNNSNSWKIRKYWFYKPTYIDGKLVIYTDDPFEGGLNPPKDTMYIYRESKKSDNPLKAGTRKGKQEKKRFIFKKND